MGKGGGVSRGLSICDGRTTVRGNGKGLGQRRRTRGAANSPVRHALARCRAAAGKSKGEASVLRRPGGDVRGPGPRIGCVTVFQPCRRPACLADRWILAPERKAESSRSSGLAIDVVSGHLKVDFTALRGTCGPYRTGFAHRKNDEISAAQTVCRSDDGLDRHQ